ncbi:MAG: TolB-like 6-bladed beta-propeller domain-containing protein [Prolixibacteraceae bacterium]|nr:TolB-like 6-bladed beta-propeller domain-containing protein [Prolixibacteraceae bacterium]
MNYKHFYYCLLLMQLGCNSATTKDPILADFSKTMQLKMENSSIKSSDIGEIVDMLVIDSLLISDEIFSKKIFKLYNKRTGKLLSNFIDKGRGPNEMLFPRILNYYNSDYFTLFDEDKRELIYFSLNEIRNKNYQFYCKKNVELTADESFATKSYLLSDSMLLCTGFFANGQYALYNLNSKNTNFFLDYPYDENHKGESNRIKGTAFQGEISIKPDRKKFANATRRIFEICEIQQTDIKRIFRKIYFFPEYKVIHNSAAFLSTQPYGFHSITSTDTYVYLIYSGRSMKEYGNEYYAGNNLLVYDWDGNPVVNFILDRYLKSFALDVKQMKIYGYCTNPISGEPEIVTYQLPQN